MPLTKLIEKQALRDKKQVFLSERNLKAFKEAYACCEGDVFDFEGHPVLLSYAEYLIEYFEGVPVSQESSVSDWCWQSTKKSMKETEQRYTDMWWDGWRDRDYTEPHVTAAPATLVEKCEPDFASFTKKK